MKNLYDKLLNKPKEKEDTVFYILKEAEIFSLNIVKDYQQELRDKGILLDEVIVYTLELLFYFFDNYKSDGSDFLAKFGEFLKVSFKELTRYPVSYEEYEKAKRRIRKLTTEYLQLLLINEYYEVDMEFEKNNKIIKYMKILYSNLNQEDKDVMRNRFSFEHSDGRYSHK